MHNNKIRALAAPEPDIEPEAVGMTTNKPPGAFAAHNSARNPSFPVCRVAQVYMHVLSPTGTALRFTFPFVPSGLLTLT